MNDCSFQAMIGVLACPCLACHQKSSNDKFIPWFCFTSKCCLLPTFALILAGLLFMNFIDFGQIPKTGRQKKNVNVKIYEN